MSPRKPISELTPEEAEARRARDRLIKNAQREGKPAEKDKRGYRDRKEYMKAYRARLKADRGSE
jgi:hypothetical protein